MSITKAIGKNTLGGGKKMETSLHNYHRSTHDLSYIWRNTQSVGTLVPFMAELALPGDTWEIGLTANVLTHPTVGPLYGSFKLQLDVFECPIRLYQAMLHNNKLGIGLDMAKVKLPKLQITETTPMLSTNKQISSSSILAYLGLRGWGVKASGERTFSTNAIKIIAYWDIFKNYYANKQEDYAYVINPETIDVSMQKNTATATKLTPTYEITLEKNDTVKITASNTALINQAKEIVWNVKSTYQRERHLKMSEFMNTKEETTTSITYEMPSDTARVYSISLYDNYYANKLNSFELTKIDDLREDILSQKNNEFIINENDTKYPFISNLLKKVTTTYQRRSTFPQSGLALKTYQSDINNNWINTEWIDGDNGINAITAIDTSDGSFTLDTLNIAKKVYDMLNRIAISGGTYKDWIETVYTNDFIMNAETPVYMGGMSQEVIFQEVISNSATEDEPLGSLAGRGKLADNKKGGFIKIKTKEPAYIIGIVSLTPRIDYSQGNKWDNDLDTMDDLHKPALDGIGFQDLNCKQMAWWAENTNGTIISAGKQPAWLNYMTNVNQAYGNFASGYNENYMILDRNYEISGYKIGDLTTYIDPSKFNNIFADESLDSMNFWVQIGCNIKARRKMSAKIIPNL